MLDCVLLEKIKNKLLMEKAQLISKSYHTEVDMDGDEIDEIQAKLLASITKQLSNRDSQKIILIDLALKKIEDNSFGNCEECGDNISEKRLEINPHFILCISCAEQKEFEDKQRKRM